MEKRENSNPITTVGADASSKESEDISDSSNDVRIKRLVRKIDFHLMPFMVFIRPAFRDFLTNLLTLAAVLDVHTNASKY